MNHVEAAFREVTQRNALRRAACLPLLDVRKEVEAFLDRQHAREFAAASERHHDELLRFRREVVEECRQRTSRDFTESAGGRVAVRLLAYRRFVTFMRQMGYTPSRGRGVVYGSGRATQGSSS